MLFATMFDNFGRIALGFLAIAGGFMLGNLTMWFVSRFVCKIVIKKKPAELLEKILRLLGGIIGAILVALLVFGDGGFGFGGSGGGRPGGPGGDSQQQPNDSKDELKDPPKKEKTNPKETPDSDVETVKITIRKAVDYPKSFQFEGEKEGCDLAAAKKLLRSIKESSKGKLKQVAIHVYANSTSKKNQDVEDFEEYVKSLGLTPSYPPVQNQPLPE